MASYTPAQITQIITDQATKLGIPPEVALAIAHQESGLNYASIGDNGHSIGLFQLNDQGEGAGMSVAAREDPVTNARIALTQVANVMKQNPSLSWGEIAAAAQRPADRQSYAQAINTALAPSMANKALGIAGSLTGTRPANVPDQPVGSTPIDLSQFAAQNGIPPEWVNDPELGPLIQQWDNGQISDDQFYASARQTKIWQTTPASERTRMADQATDPATLSQQIGLQTQAIQREAQKLGVTLSAAQAENLGTQAYTQNWTDAQIQASVAGLGNYSQGAKLQGETLTDQQQLQGIYDAYAVPIDQATLSKQLAQIVGSSDPSTALSSAQSAIANQAKTLWASNPQLVQAITDGQTTSQWAAPYLSHASTLLGVPTSNMNLNAPMWQAVLNPAKNQQGVSTGAALSLDQWDQQLRTNPQYGFDSSSTAIQEASNLATGLAQKLGFGA